MRIAAETRHIEKPVPRVLTFTACISDLPPLGRHRAACRCGRCEHARSKVAVGSPSRAPDRCGVGTFMEFPRSCVTEL